MKVLITGAGGFIGSHLVEYQIKKERKVVALDIDTSRLSHLKDRGNLEIVQGDIKNETLLDRILNDVELVFNLASVHLSIATSEEEYRKVNVEATKNLLRICNLKGVGRFIHCSSVGVYGKTKNPPVSENAACEPKTIYDMTKLEGERAAREFYKETGFPIVIVRPAWVYGPRCPRTMRLFRSIKHGKFFFVGDGKALRHCIYVDDLVDGFELMGTSEKAVGQTYNMADTQPVSINELVRKIADISQTPPPRLQVPVWAIYPVCFTVEMGFTLFKKEPPISRRSLNFFTGNTNFDISKAKNELGFEPRNNIQEGLRLTFEWLKDNEIPDKESA